MEPERILETSTNDDGELFFLIKWKNCVDEDLVPAKEVNLKIPQLAIKFFEERLAFIDNHTEDEEEIERRRLVIWFNLLHDIKFDIDFQLVIDWIEPNFSFTFLHNLRE